MKTFALLFHLLRRSSRTGIKRMVLTAVAIAWGTVSIVLMLSFGEGLRRQLKTGMGAQGTDFGVVWPGSTSRPFAGLPAGRGISLTIQDAEALAEGAPSACRVSGEIINWGRTFSVDGKNLTARLSAVHPVYGEIRNCFLQKGGRFINPLDISQKRRVIVLGDELKETLFGNGEAVGKTLFLERAEYTVVGVLSSRFQIMMYSGPDSKGAWVPITTYRDQFGTDRLNNLVFKPASYARMEAAKNEIYALLGRRRQFDPEDAKALFIFDPKAYSGPTESATFAIEILLGVIGMITLSIGGVGVANIMIAVIRERTRQIGIQMALGARHSWILLAFLAEGLLQTLLGGLLGIAAASGIVLGVNRWTEGMPKGASNIAFEFLGHPTFSPPVAMTVAGLLGVIGLAAGYFPARRSSRIDPARTLRYIS